MLHAKILSSASPIFILPRYTRNLTLYVLTCICWVLLKYKENNLRASIMDKDPEFLNILNVGTCLSKI